MLFIIFTVEGLNEAKPQVLEEKAALWLNPGLKDEADLSALTSAGIQIEFLPDEVDANNEKAVLAALTHVEKNSPKTQIFIEYL